MGLLSVWRLFAMQSGLARGRCGKKIVEGGKCSKGCVGANYASFSDDVDALNRHLKMRIVR